MLAYPTLHVSRARRVKDAWISCTGLLILIIVAGRLFNAHGHWQYNSRQPRTSNVSLVVASQTEDNTTWLMDGFKEWRKIVYVTDDTNAMFTVPKNKGREGAVYLTYIIDHYDELPGIAIFSHANRYQWHNDDPLYDGQRVLSRLQLPYVEQQGYANLRCVWTLGCPSEIRPHTEAGAPGPASDPTSSEARAGSFYKDAFEYLFPGVAVPQTVGATCCAQFAVTAGTIRQRPKEDYVRYRSWLLQTDLNDDLAGRIMEYSWHIIFGQEAVFCPSAQQCYCQLYGLCKFHCEEEGVCGNFYTLPTTTTFPPGWPEFGRDGQRYNLTQMEEEYNNLLKPSRHPASTQNANEYFE